LSCLLPLISPKIRCDTTKTWRKAALARSLRNHPYYTCKDDIKSAKYNVDQDCNDYDQRQLHVIESLGLMLNTPLIANDNQRTDKQRIASEGFSRALGSHLRTQRGLFDVSTMFLPQRGIWWSTGNSGRICLVIEV